MGVLLYSGLAMAHSPLACEASMPCSQEASLSWRGVVVLKWVKMGNKWAQFTRLTTPNSPGSFLEKHFFDPFLTHC